MKEILRRMRLKLDENLGPTVQRVFVKAGHDDPRDGRSDALPSANVKCEDPGASRGAT